MIILYLSLKYEYCTKLTNILTNICNANNTNFVGLSFVAWWWPMRSKDVAAELLHVINNTCMGCVYRLYMYNVFVMSNSYFFTLFYCLSIL
jgi:hypothetical protein